MAIKKVQIIPPNYTDIIHPETDSEVVLMNSGNTLQAEYDNHITEDSPHQYGNRFIWQYNSATDSLDLVVI